MSCKASEQVRRVEGREGFVEFLATHCEITGNPEDRINKNVLISFYTTFCSSKEFPVISQICMGRYLSKLGVWRGAREGGRNGQQSVYLGLRYLPDGVVPAAYQDARETIMKQLKTVCKRGEVKKPSPIRKGKEVLEIFLKQNYEVTKDSRDMINTEHLYCHYKQFCEYSDCLPLSKVSVGRFIGKKMNVRAVKVTGGGRKGKLGYGYPGLRLVEEANSCCSLHIPCLSWEPEMEMCQLEGESEDMVVEVDVMSLLQQHQQSESSCHESPLSNPETEMDPKPVDDVDKLLDDLRVNGIYSPQTTTTTTQIPQAVHVPATDFSSTLAKTTTIQQVPQESPPTSNLSNSSAASELLPINVWDIVRNYAPIYTPAYPTTYTGPSTLSSISTYLTNPSMEPTPTNFIDTNGMEIKVGTEAPTLPTTAMQSPGTHESNGMMTMQGQQELYSLE